MSEPIKVAIVGGGCASVSTAFELTRPELAGRYQVTLYQLGWRLGGKGASGRGPADRIEEHGLHLWMGWYENAFRLIRECYAELGRDPESCRMADWTDAFEPDHFVGVADRLPDGDWAVWRAHFPPAPGLPGDPYPEGFRMEAVDYLQRSLSLVRSLLSSLPIQASDAAAAQSEAASGGDALRAQISRLLRVGELMTLTAMLEGIALFETALGSLAAAPDPLFARFIETLADNARAQLAGIVDRDPEVRRLWTILDLTLATVRGLLRAWPEVTKQGFDALDDYDCREWLLLNDASESSVNSGYLAGLYDLGFSYEDADPGRPRIAAGQAVRATLRAFFSYRGAFFWKMQAGMGDVIFAPFYEVLRRRGVRFEFFHRLENVRIARAENREDDSRGFVEALEFDVQARIRGSSEYQPLVDVRGLPCWPSQPDFRQLVDGRQLQAEGRDFECFWDRRRVDTRTLRVGEDFDLVVLGLSLGAVPYVCREIVERDPDWRAMVTHVKTVATQAFQVWLRSDLKELGWTQSPINVSGFVEPFDTWADMRHLIPAESWPDPPRTLAYFCSVLPDLDDPEAADYPSRQRERVLQNAVDFLDHDIVHLWPRAQAAPGRFRWDELLAPACSPGETPGPQRLSTQFWTANVNPSDRYVLSLPGSQVYRISPLARHYDNLTICGDWTDCGFNAGCVEAAVMSGRLAAHALSSSPKLEEIIGFDHP